MRLVSGIPQNTRNQKSREHKEQTHAQTQDWDSSVMVKEYHDQGTSTEAIERRIVDLIRRVKRFQALNRMLIRDMSTHEPILHGFKTLRPPPKRWPVEQMSVS